MSVGDLLDSGALVPAVVTALVCAGLALGAPALLARVPEPDEPDPDKPAYAVLAAAPRLSLRLAAASGVLGLLVGGALGWAWALPVWWVLVPAGVLLAHVDWRTMLLPTWLVARLYAVVVPLVVVGTLVGRDLDDLLRAGTGWAVAGGLYLLLWLVHPRGLGYGDVRLSGVLGIALGQLGWAELLVGTYAGFLLGGVLGGLLSVLRVVERKGFPFGPFMLLGAVVGAVAGPALAGLAA
ncbi:prepilin peptidase [Nocardioides perillae]|uniref:Leader peptidase (Prepilin peptidase)/N-methyltransferase n=1 Tax=Nocardioides perillae TaxID=1119534 RepID=A0A7Y9RX03_9ACTN|nr:leader peptidase (prepilin peptidase)/N-methyltransferase [Nocardioides perillae]